MCLPDLKKFTVLSQTSKTARGLAVRLSDSSGGRAVKATLSWRGCYVTAAVFVPVCGAWIYTCWCTQLDSQSALCWWG